MTRSTIAFVVPFLTGACASVRVQPASEPAGVSSPRGTTAADSKVAQNDTIRARQPARALTLSLFTAGVYDSNIERDHEDEIASRGFVYGGGARYRTSEDRPRFTVSYEVANHSYTRNDEFDRVSQRANAVYTRLLTPTLLLETIAEASFKGSSEDRDVGNQYMVIPRLNYRVSSSQRLRLYGAYRLRRYDQDIDRDATNLYAGLEFRDEAQDDGRWEYGFRYETNDARAERRSYTRRTYHTAYSRMFGRNDFLIAEMKYRSQRYDKRFIEVEDEETARHDHRISPTVEWSHRFGRGFSMIASYDFENRFSNDPEGRYRDHVLMLTARYDW